MKAKRTCRETEFSCDRMTASAPVEDTAKKKDSALRLKSQRLVSGDDVLHTGSNSGVDVVAIGAACCDGDDEPGL